MKGIIVKLYRQDEDRKFVSFSTIGGQSVVIEDDHTVKTYWGDVVISSTWADVVKDLRKQRELK